MSEDKRLDATSGSLEFVEKILHDNFRWDSYADELDLINAVKAYVASEIAELVDANATFQMMAERNETAHQAFVTMHKMGMEAKDEEIARAKEALAMQLTNFKAKYAELNGEFSALKAGVDELKWVVVEKDCYTEHSAFDGIYTVTDWLNGRDVVATFNGYPSRPVGGYPSKSVEDAYRECQKDWNAVRAAHVGKEESR